MEGCDEKRPRQLCASYQCFHGKIVVFDYQFYSKITPKKHPLKSIPKKHPPKKHP
jgi:hypothetical protein